MICTFFGHGECYELDAEIVLAAIENLITKGTDTFYVGHQGHFDSIVLDCLTQLKKKHPHISFSVVLAYLPAQHQEYEHSICHEGIEIGPPRFAIERRNKWMIDKANHCICYINHTWGGAYKFTKKAKLKGLEIINLGSADL